MVSGRPRIGLFIANLHPGYFQSVWEGAVDAAAQSDVDLVTFVGGSLGSPLGYEALRSTVYDLAGPDCIDAVVVLADSVGRYLGRRAMEDLHARVGVSAVSLEARLANVPVIRADDLDGMRALLSHFVDGHGFRRIAFIQGPEGNSDAEYRYKAYRTALEQHGIEFDSRLVARGYFDAASGVAATHTLLKNRDADGLDAIIAANDNMALAAMEALEMRGLNVPEDVAVAGFDDIPESIHASPSLTTVRQPLHEMGRRGVTSAIAVLRGEHVPDDVPLPVDAAIRRSCGCSIWSGTSVRGLEGVFRERREGIVFEMARPGPEGVTVAAARQIVNAFGDELAGGEAGLFAATMRTVLGSSSESAGGSIAWCEAMALLRRETLAMAAGEEFALVQDLWRGVRPLLLALERRARVREHGARWRREHLAEIGWQLAAASRTDEVFDVAARMLPEAGVTRAYVCMYEGAPAPPVTSRLVFACDTEGRIDVGHGGIAFPSRHLLPERFARPPERRGLVVEPLFVKRRQLGYVVFELGPIDGVVYDVVRRHLGLAIRSALLLEEADERANGCAAANAELTRQLMSLGRPPREAP